MQADWEMTAAEYLAAYRDWKSQYQVYESIPLAKITREKIVELRELDQAWLIWTQHSTTDDALITSGMHFFGEAEFYDQKSEGWGWQTEAFLVARVPFAALEDSIFKRAYLPCSLCNADGESENVDEECEQCEGEGFVQHDFD